MIVGQGDRSLKSLGKDVQRRELDLREPVRIRGPTTPMRGAR